MSSRKSGTKLNNETEKLTKKLERAHKQNDRFAREVFRLNQLNIELEGKLAAQKDTIQAYQRAADVWSREKMVLNQNVVTLNHALTSLTMSVTATNVPIVGRENRE